MAELYLVSREPLTEENHAPLLRAFGFDNWHYLENRLNILNLADDQPYEEVAHRLRAHWHIFYPEVHVLCTSSRVFKYFTGRHVDLYKGLALYHRGFNTVVKCWYIPWPGPKSVFYEGRELRQLRIFLRERLRDAAGSPT